MSRNYVGRLGSPEMRFLRKINKQDNGCWLWTGANQGRGSIGYGTFRFDGKVELAHRVSAVLYLNFDIKSKLLILHKNVCTSRLCVNPEHLYIGDHRDNKKDSLEKGTDFQARKIYCPQGHEYTEDNTYKFGPKQHRMCLICKRKNDKIQTERKRSHAL